MINTILSQLGLSDEEINTYLFVLENGPHTAGSLAKKLGYPRPSIYGFLRRLINKGLVLETSKNGTGVFSSAPADKIKLILEQKIEHLQNSKKEFERLLPELLKSYSKIITPKFQLFEGRDGLQNALKDALLYSNMETATYWPIKAMLDILGEDFFRYLNKERIKRNIYNRAIWPEKQKVNIKKYPYLGVGDDFLREIRIAPKEIDFQMGYWIYNNKAVFISSRKESFGFIIESKEFVEMLLSQFEVIWHLSKTIK